MKKTIYIILGILSLLAFNENLDAIYLNIIGLISFYTLMKLNNEKETV